MKIKNLPLVVGIALPFVFILLISIFVFMPSWSIKPQYNFLYSNQGDSYYQEYKNIYKVVKGRLTVDQIVVQPGATYKGDFPPVFLYEVRNNTSHEISLDDAKDLTLDAGPSSPDGYGIRYESDDYGIFDLFGGSGNDRGYVVYKGNAQKKLTGLSSNGYYYNDNFQFIGWVK